MRALSWRAQNRLHGRYTRLLARRLQRNKAIVAVARELCGFICELLRMQPCYEQVPPGGRFEERQFEGNRLTKGGSERKSKITSTSEKRI